MNVILWIVQAILALLYLSGGAYKTFAFAEVASQMRALPHGLWRVLGVVEMVGGVLLIVPAALNWQPGLTPSAAAVLAVETFALSGVYARYSRKVAATNPLVWSLVMGVLAAFVAYGRYVLVPV